MSDRSMEEQAPISSVTPATVVMETRSLLEEKVEAQAEHLRQCCLEAATEFGGTCEATIERLYFHYALAETEPPIQAVRTACENWGSRS